MSPRLLQPAIGRIGTWQPGSRKLSGSSCLICASASLAGHRPARRKPTPSRFRPDSSARQESNQAAKIPNNHDHRVPNPAKEIPTLKAALIELQKHFRSYVNLSRLQLCLRALEQRPGEETIRIAVLALPGQRRTSSKARELVRLLLADPLKQEEEWERTLTRDQDLGKPILLRIGEDMNDLTNSGINNRLIKELSISSPTLNAHRLEILIMDADNLSETVCEEEDLANAILVPSVEIPVSSTGKYTPVTTPVHKALLVGEGILGAASLIKLPLQTNPDIITSTVDLPGLSQDDRDQVPFQVLDVLLAKSALSSFRESLGNAMVYEHDWFKSGVPELLQWVKAGALDTPGSMKTPIRALLDSVLVDTSRQIEYEESRQLSALLSLKVSSPAVDSLRGNLNFWAQRAHTELRDQLDVAFEGRRWSRLGWWKLFWRVDDVSMIASDILYQRFLTNAEKEIIYLAGKIEEAGTFKAFPPVQQDQWAYKPLPEEHPSATLGSPPPPLQFKDILETPPDDKSTSIQLQPWPLQIPTTRAYLSAEAVPALQALGQKLVLQTLTTSSFASAFAGLVYVSSLTTGLYEAGAIAAFGIVWSMRRMQKNWETARKFWEGEVREEGRKAVRAVESAVSDVLTGPGQRTIEGAEELQQARKAVKHAQEALERVNSN